MHIIQFRKKSLCILVAGGEEEEEEEEGEEEERVPSSYLGFQSLEKCKIASIKPYLGKL